MRFDVPLAADYPDLTATVNELADAGVDGLFTLEGNRDVFLPLALAAATGRTLDLYPNVAVALPRSPMHLAYQAWDMQRLSQGRFALGLGSQIKTHIEKRYSARWHKPVAQMRELTAAIKAIFACWHDGAKLDFRGDYYTLTVMTPTFVPAALETLPPIWIGGLGPKMTEMAADTADGVLIHPFNSEHYLRTVTMPAVDRGLATSGRTRDQFTIGVDVMLGVYETDAERETAIDGCRFNLAFYGSTPAYKVTLDAHGWGDLQTDLHTLSRQGRWTEMAALIDDDVLHTIAAVGTPAEIGSLLRSHYDGIADRIAVTIPYRVRTDLLAATVDALRP
jgi:probable F420-dependent oxidoreductase